MSSTTRWAAGRSAVATMMAVLVAGFAWAGCGGGSASSGKGARRGKNTTRGGTEVTREGLNRWNAAMETFNRYEEQGWNNARCDETIGDFEEAVEAQGGQFAEAVYMAGLVASRCDDEGRARNYYNRSLNINEKYCKARVAIGLMQMDGGNQQEAFATFQRALRDDTRCTEAYVNVALVQRTRGGAQVREALNNLRRALAIDATYLPAFNQMALLYLEQGQQRDNKEMLDLAGVVCRQAQLIDRDYAPIYNTWGLINVEKGNIIEATQLFERAINLDGEMFEAHMNFGQITLSFRGYEDAKSAFTKAVALRPSNYDAHIGLGAAHRGLRQMAEAEREYERAIELKPGRPEAYFNLGVLYQDYKSGNVADLEKAKGYYNQFLSRAQGREPFSDPRDEVQRRCRQQNRGRGRRRRRRSTDCRPGRLQNIDTALDALRAAAEMQRRSRSGSGG